MKKKTTKRPAKKNITNLDRRNFVKVLPALGIANVAGRVGANSNRRPGRVADAITIPIANAGAPHHERDDASDGKADRHRVH
jgi:hypothetical protein